MLETANSIYDPLGMLVPVEINCRMFLQKLWKEKLDWDYISDWDIRFEDRKDLKDEWCKIRKECLEALEINIKRELDITNESELHIFSDASAKAYGAVAYLVKPRNNNSPGHSQFLMNKAKVTTLKRLENEDTTPKNELMGMLLAANLAELCLKY